MSIQRFLLAFTALAIITLVGCKQPIGVPSEVHAATTQTIYCRPDGSLDATGHIDWYQTVYGLSGGNYDWDTDTITRGYTDSAGHNWPRRIGICVFKIPYFECPNGLPTCTLFYYQESHTSYGDSLLINGCWVEIQWPPQAVDYDDLFGAAWGSTETLAVDITHSSDGWHSIALSTEVCGAIADSGAANEYWTLLYTGWVYRGSVDGTYTNVAGDYDLDYAPYIKSCTTTATDLTTGRLSTGGRAFSVRPWALCWGLPPHGTVPRADSGDAEPTAV